MADRTSLEFNGNWFEQRIAQRLSMEFRGARVLHDCKLYCRYKEGITQIDVILVHEDGICAVEAKNWSGYLKGEYGDTVWTGKSDDPMVKTIVNPVDQNFMHIRALKNALRRKGFKPGRFYNYVCVPDTTDIYSRCSEVCNLSMLVKRLKEQERAWTGAGLDVVRWSSAIMGVCLQGINSVSCSGVLENEDGKKR